MRLPRVRRPKRLAWNIGLVLALVLCGGVAESRAQAVFGVNAAASTVIRGGHTELMGPVAFIINSGVSASGSIELSLSVDLTNIDEAGIDVVGTGGLAGTSLLGASGDTVVVDVPAGGVTGDVIAVSGLRFSAADSDLAFVEALVSTSRNLLVAGQTQVELVESVVDGVLLDEDSDFTFGFRNNAIYDDFDGMTFTEGHEAAFSSAIGTLGQTVATRIRFRVQGVPDNVSVTFPDEIESITSNAKFTLQNGVDPVVTDQHSGLVTYVFADASPSQSIGDSFELELDLSRTEDGPFGTGTASIQLAMFPVGAAVPDADFPSEDVPRFREEFIPDIAPPPPAPPLFTLVVPEDAGTFSAIVTNTGAETAPVMLTARGADGLPVDPAFLVDNPITLNLDAGVSLDESLAGLFGNQADTGLIASISAESEDDDIIGRGLAEFPGGRVVVGPLPAGTTFRLPFDRRTASESPSLLVLNSGVDAASVRVRVFDRFGTGVVDEETLDLDANATWRSPLDSIFGVGAGSLPLDGYVSVATSSTTQIRTVLFQNVSDGAAAVVGRTISAISNTTAPFFAFGAGYNTILTIVNGSGLEAGLVTVSLFESDGTPLAAPFTRRILPRERSDFDFEDLFALQPGLNVGHFTVQILTEATNPFASPPRVSMTAWTGVGDTLAAAALPTVAAGEVVLSPTVATGLEFTGIAVVNATAADTTVSVETFQADGRDRGATNFTLAPGESAIRLLRELTPDVLERAAGYVRISSTPGNVRVAAYRGAWDLSELLYVESQVAP